MKLRGHLGIKQYVLRIFWLEKEVLACHISQGIDNKLRFLKVGRGFRAEWRGQHKGTRSRGGVGGGGEGDHEMITVEITQAPMHCIR